MGRRLHGCVHGIGTMAHTPCARIPPIVFASAQKADGGLLVYPQSVNAMEVRRALSHRQGRCHLALVSQLLRLAAG
jgi:hypothetical protein